MELPDSGFAGVYKDGCVKAQRVLEQSYSRVIHIAYGSVLALKLPNQTSLYIQVAFFGAVVPVTQ